MSRLRNLETIVIIMRNENQYFSTKFHFIVLTYSTRVMIYWKYYHNIKFKPEFLCTASHPIFIALSAGCNYYISTLSFIPIIPAIMS